MADAIPYAELLRLKQELQPDYQTRHDALRNLRKYWHGDFWRLADSESHPVATIFRDWSARQSDYGPDVKLVKNVVQQVCVKFQTFLSQLPQIRVYVDPPESDNRRAQATLKERFLYGCWSEGNMNKQLNQMAWYLPLMGDCYLGIWPNTERDLPMPLLRSPEYAWPIMSFDGCQENATMFIWKVSEQQALRNFKSYVPPDERFKSSKVLGRLRKRPNDDKGDAAGGVQIIEYTDANQWCLYVDENLEKGVQHNFGWNLFEHIKFIDVPGEAFGHGAVEQAVNMNEMENALLSLTMQSAIDNAFPMLVLEDPQKAPEEIERGPGAILPLNAGGKAYNLAPAVEALGIQTQLLRTLEHDIIRASGMGETEFGQSPASSIVTGKAVDALQAAGSGNTIEMVQGNSLGPGLVAWNEKCLTMGQTVFRDTTMRLYGRSTPDTFQLQGRQFALPIKGKELVGSNRNEVVFQVALGQHEKLVMGLQAQGGGIVSKKYVREQIGIPDNQHMVEEILVENVDDAVLQFMQAALQAQADPATAAQVEQQATAFLSGATPQTHDNTQQHPLLGQPPQAAGAPAASPAPGPPGLPAQAPPSLPGLPGGPGLPQAPAGPAAGPPQAGAEPVQGSQTVTLDQAKLAFTTVQGLQGRVFLVGRIVGEGQTDGPIDVALTNPADKRVIDAALPQWHGRLVYHIVQNEPVEPHVEVTAGSAQQPGGDEGAVAALVGG